MEKNMLKSIESKPRKTPNSSKGGESKRKSSRGLDINQKDILSDLLRVKAASPLEFELETNRIGEENISDKLEELAKMGYVNVDRELGAKIGSATGGRDERQYWIFYLSWKTRWLRILGII